MGIQRKVFYPVAFSAMLFASSAMAKINPTAFVGVTEFFLKDKAKNIDMGYFDPTLGEVALETGLMENIRFSGPYEAGFNQKGERDYTKDTSKDPLWNVAKILFPSNNGQLGTTTDATTNFAKYVKNPKTVALLLNYAKQVEDVKGKGNLAAKVTQNFSADILKTLEDMGEGKSTIENFKKVTLNPLLNSIRESIEAEKKGTSLYPRHTTEQVIEAFFCYHFNTQEEVIELLGILDESIVDKNKPLPTQIHYLEKKDLSVIAAKPALNLGDLFDLTQATIFTSPTPYKTGINLLNNGPTNYYDRENNSYIQGKTFQDCVETAGRHISNLLTFNPISRKFDLTAIEAFVREKERTSGVKNLYFENFKNFYSKQTFLMANAGDIGTRSLWNTVVGNLPKTIYRREGSNEIKSGFINLLNTFDTLFSLSLKPAPTSGFNAKETWVKESLQTLFAALNPSYSYVIDLTTSEFENELIGGALVTARDMGMGKNENLFSFNLSSKVNVGGGHTEVNSLKILTNQEGVVDYTKDIEKHLDSLKKGTAEESLLLLASPALQKNIHPLYQLYSQPLFDNRTKINFLKKLSENYESWKNHPSFKNNLPLIHSMSRNVMGGIAWEDSHVVETLSPVIKEMLNDPDLSILGSFVKAVNFQDWRLEEIEEADKKLPNLEYIYFDKNKEITDFFPKKTFKNVKMISFAESTVQKLELDSFLQLESMFFNKANNLEEASLKNLLALKSLDFLDLNIKKISINNAPQLDALSWLNAHNLQEVALKDLDNVTALSCGGLPVQKIELDTLPKLLTLYLADTPELQELSLKNLNDLNILMLSHSGIKKLEVDALPGLEFFSAPHTKQLQAFSFKGTCNTLTKLDLEESRLSSLTGIHFLPNLKVLNLKNAQNIQELEFTTDQKDLTLSLAGSGIKSRNQITGIEYLDEDKIEWQPKSPDSRGNSDNLWDSLY